MFRKINITRELRSLKRFYHKDKAPAKWTFGTFVEFMADFVNFSERFSSNEARHKTIGGSSCRAILMASMHFQDVYNYQIERVRRCIVHYAAPDGRVYPFCTYNCGPCHRKRVEKGFAVSSAEYLSQTRRNQTAGSV